MRFPIFTSVMAKIGAYCGNSLRIMLARIAMSRAVVTDWSGPSTFSETNSGRPFGLNKMGIGHAERRRGRVHQLDERLFAAGNLVGEHQGDVVRRFYDQGLHGQVHLELAADGHASRLGGWLCAACVQITVSSGESLPSRIASKVM